MRWTVGLGCSLLWLGSLLPVPAPGAPVLAQGEPPALRLEAGGATLQTAGIGTFCWETGCVRKVGTLTPAEPLTVTARLSATLVLDYTEAPSGYAMSLFPLVDADLAGEGQGWKAWRPSGLAESVPISATLRQGFSLEPAPGLYLLQVAAAWSAEAPRDVIYGFLLRIAPADGEPTPTPGATRGATATAAASATPWPRPPELTVELEGVTHPAHLGTFCWAGLCGDMPGIITRQQAVSARGSRTLSFELAGSAPPSELELHRYGVAASEGSPFSSGLISWPIKRGEGWVLDPVLAQSVVLPPARGWQVLYVFARWETPERGDGFYGLLLDYGAEALYLPWLSPR